MYPKKPTSHSQGASRKYLTLSQKEALKAQIADRLSKKYGLKYQDLINTQVNNCLDANKNMTSDVLQNLENNIQKMTSGQQQPQQNQNYQEDDKSIKSGHSKMSGAENFDIIDQMLMKSKGPQKEQQQLEATQRSQAKKMDALNLSKPEKDLDFLEEEDEWAAIFKYNRYLYEKEAALLKEKERKQKLKNRADLDAQVREKEEKKKREINEDQLYSQNLKLQMERFDERERQKQELENQIRAQEKIARSRQIKENKYKRRHEEKQEKALDSFLMMKVREELDAEQKYMEFKREHQRQVMEQLRKENDERIRQVKEEEDAERQENIKLMQAYSKLIDEQEAERERTMKERDQKMKEFQLRASVTTMQENEDKLKKLDDRREKYENRHEKKLEQIEQEKKRQAAQQKQELKSYLFQQMDQRQQRSKVEKQEYNQQADICEILLYLQCQNHIYLQKQKNLLFKLNFTYGEKIMKNMNNSRARKKPKNKLQLINTHNNLKLS